MKELRRRKTLAIRAINQAVEELEVQGCGGEALRQLVDNMAELTAAAGGAFYQRTGRILRRHGQKGRKRRAAPRPHALETA